jgi:hypothetical protein
MDAAIAPPLRPLRYPVPTRALSKWAAADLAITPEMDGAMHCRYHYTGSTCTDGGASFTATFHAVLQAAAAGMIIQKAWIDLPLKDNPGAAQMCAYLTQRDAFLAELSRPPAFCGQTLEDAIAQPGEMDYAGCLCFEPMVNHKWRNVLSTIHYALWQARAAAP